MRTLKIGGGHGSFAHRSQFQAKAEILDAQESKKYLADAVLILAAWIELARDYLSEDDMPVLISVGGLLYREELRKRST